MHRLVYITRNYKNINQGGGKARVDVEDILSEIGAVNLGYPRSYNKNKVVDYLFTLGGVLKMLRSLRKGDILVLQYPVKKYYRLICRTARSKGVKTITLIHDLGSFRRKKLTVEEEIEKLSLTDFIIAANKNTISWLKANGCKVPMTEQTVWDYLSDAVPSAEEQPPMSCMFVGNLKPSYNGFLYDLPSAVTVHLYGAGAPENLPANIINHGLTDPYRIISEGEGRYGLIWYGTAAVYSSEGYIGDYIKLCNPHKLALYIRSRKPVIIWKEAAGASFVNEKGIGITVDSLENLESVLKGISEQEYHQMLENIDRLIPEIATGFYIRRAIEEAVEVLEGR